MRKNRVFPIILASLLVLGLALASCENPSSSSSKPKNYTVTFNVNGGTGTTPTTQTVKAGSSINLPSGSGLSKTGFTFGGWNTKADGTGANFSGGSAYLPEGDVTLYVKWDTVTVITYSIIYNSNGGTGTMANSSHTYDVEKTLNLNTFTRAGYTFDGWAETPDGAVKYTNGQSVKNLSDTAGSTVTLYAKWVDSATVWTVVFETNGGSGVGDAVIIKNTTVSRPSPDPGRIGYIFDNWYSNVELSALFNFSSVVLSNMTLYAKWNPISYTVIYDKNATDAVGTISNSNHTYDVNAILNANTFTRTGYTFSGWAKTADGALEFYDTQSVINLSVTAGANVTLYAKWDPITYTITYDKNSADATGTMINSIHTYDVDKSLNTNTFSRSGYTLAGWSRTENGVVEFNNGQSVKNLSNVAGATVTLYAVWVDSSTVWTVRFETNGGNAIGEAVIPKGNSINRPVPDPSRTGYTFINWYSNMELTALYIFSSAVLSNMTLYAKWDPITYTIVYNKNDVNATGTMANSSHIYDVDKILNANAFSRTGYTFGGWAKTSTGTAEFNDSESVKNLSSTAGATVTLYAKWIPDRYIITFNANNGVPVPTQQIIDHDGKVSEPGAMTRTGYTFGGWFKETSFNNQWNFASDTVTGSITLYAKWTPITYNVAYDKVATDVTGTMANSSHTYDVDKNLTNNVFTRTGYIFVGWARTSGGAVEFANGQSVRNLTTTAGATVTLYASWNALPSSAVINVPFIGPTEKNVSITRVTANNLSKSGGGSITLTINESFDRYEWFVGVTNVASGNNVTLQASNPAFTTGNNWITAVVYTGTGANAIPWSGELVIYVRE